MEKDVIFAGFGGQGVMLIGQLLANAAMMQDLQSIWMPSYGPEMRGGTANCTVVISDEPIGSPVVPNPQCAVALNRPSLDKFEPLTKPDGLIIVNSSLIDRKVERDDVTVVYIDANHIAEKEIGMAKAMNMILLGAYVGRSGAVEVDMIKKAMAEKMKGKERFLPMNEAAVDLGVKLAAEQATA